MAPVLAPPVEPPAVTDIQPPPHPAQIAFGWLDQQVLAIGHEHVGLQPRAEAFGQFGQPFHKVLPVALIAKDIPPLVAAGSEVLPPAGPLDAQRPCHAGIPSRPHLSFQLSNFEM